MSDRSGVSRGDRNRNARLARLREAVPLSNAIVGIDLADRKQMVVVTDHESRVLARRTFRRRAWELDAALDWAAARGAVANRGTEPHQLARIQPAAQSFTRLARQGPHIRQLDRRRTTTHKSDHYPT